MQGWGRSQQLDFRRLKKRSPLLLAFSAASCPPSIAVSPSMTPRRATGLVTRGTSVRSLAYDLLKHPSPSPHALESLLH